MERYERLKKLKPEIFKRLTGVKPDTFKAKLEDALGVFEGKEIGN